ncbi:hypothetical protein KUV75_14380 [Qipengyuania gaetbuli]|uniref:ATP-grasp fold amidoligase family protein n=1 Tax=Qipengyuania gaetbuli TaxID=266952 RepID=UPI001C99A840|nr:ATP-grasp fold amidoligase family protein [Qipengyuania gaetbuli]MBY6016081.1 hypothetical protein [Qipengyuania gaetbuli]
MRKLLQLLPHGRYFDRIFLFVIFVYAHRRIPKRSSGFANDYFYFLKKSQEIFDIYRQITSDKVLVKEFIEQRCGKGLTIDTVAVFDRIDEIKLNELPKPCVLKPAHSSGTVIFITPDQKLLSIEDQRRLESALESSPYKTAREGNYKYLRARLVCEPMLPEGVNVKDYKIFCFKGMPRLIQVDSERHSGHQRNIYKADWTPLEIRYNFPIGAWEAKPQRLDDMLQFAKVLSLPFEFVRVDFFIEGRNIFIGELTHCPESAHGQFGDQQQEKLFSDILFADGPV